MFQSSATSSTLIPISTSGTPQTIFAAGKRLFPRCGWKPPPVILVWSSRLSRTLERSTRGRFWSLNRQNLKRGSATPGRTPTPTFVQNLMTILWVGIGNELHRSTRHPSWRSARISPKVRVCSCINRFWHPSSRSLYRRSSIAYMTIVSMRRMKERIASMAAEEPNAKIDRVKSGLYLAALHRMGRPIAFRR
jgi:hypothetical protein